MNAYEIFGEPQKEVKLKKKVSSIQAAKSLCHKLRRAGFDAYARFSVVFLTTAVGIESLTVLDGWVPC